MSIEEVIKATTIEFKNPINRKDFEDYVWYLAKHIPANVKEEVKYANFYQHEGILKDERELEIHAAITPLNNRLAAWSFDTLPYIEKTSKVRGIAFCKVKNWKLSDYSEDVRGLWSQVRDLTGRYFVEKGL